MRNQLLVATIFALTFAAPSFGQDEGFDLPFAAPSEDIIKEEAPAPAEPQIDDEPEAAAPEFFGHTINADNSILFVIDRSSSMMLRVDDYVDESGKTVSGADRLQRATSELRKAIGGLPETFTFNVFFYHECVSRWKSARVKASPANKAAAFKFIATITPDGWTNTGLAVATALGDKQNKTIVLLSDGAPNFLDCGMNAVGSFEDHRGLIRTQNTQKAQITCFGIGLDGDARNFMRSVAADNGGNYIEAD